MRRLPYADVESIGACPPERDGVLADQHADTISEAERQREIRRTVAVVRLGDLKALMRHRYTGPVPETDFRYLRVAAHCMWVLHPKACADHLRAWARKWCPWVERDEFDAQFAEIVAEAIDLRRNISMADAGVELDLSWEDRDFCQIRVIEAVGVSVEERKRRKAEQRRARDRKAAKARRSARGCKDQRRSLAKLKPWEALGISRATFFRWMREGKLPRDRNVANEFETKTSPDRRMTPQHYRAMKQSHVSEEPVTLSKKEAPRNPEALSSAAAPAAKHRPQGRVRQHACARTDNPVVSTTDATQRITRSSGKVSGANWLATEQAQRARETDAIGLNRCPETKRTKPISRLRPL